MQVLKPFIFNMYDQIVLKAKIPNFEDFSI